MDSAQPARSPVRRALLIAALLCVFAAPLRAEEPDQRQCFCLQAPDAGTAPFIQYRVIQMKGVLPACDKMVFRPGPRFEPGSLPPCEKLKKCHAYAGKYAARNRAARKKIAELEAAPDDCARPGGEGTAAGGRQGCALKNGKALEHYRLEKAASESAIRSLWEVCFDTAASIENFHAEAGTRPGGPMELSMASPKTGGAPPAGTPSGKGSATGAAPGAKKAAPVLPLPDGDYGPDTREWEEAVKMAKIWCAADGARCSTKLVPALETPWRSGDCSGRLRLKGEEGWLRPSVCGGVPYALLRKRKGGWEMAACGYDKGPPPGK